MQGQLTRDIGTLVPTRGGGSVKDTPIGGAQQLCDAVALFRRQRSRSDADRAVSAPAGALPAVGVTAATTAAEPAGKTDRFERWIQGCWTLFVISAVWLVVRITALELNTEFLRLGPNDEALGLSFLLFVGLTILLANETWRRACHGLPIRNQQRAV